MFPGGLRVAFNWKVSVLAFVFGRASRVLLAGVLQEEEAMQVRLVPSGGR